MEQNLYGKTKKEFVEVLSTISKICSKHECESCPFGASNGTCYLGYTPYSWNWYLCEKEHIWRVFE